MDDSVLSFTQVRVNNDLLNEVWTFDPRRLDEMEGKTLSMYAMALAQYLVYFTYQRNLTKADIYKKNKFIERTISLSMTKTLLKEYKTKAAATDYLISTDVDLIAAQSQLDDFQEELLKIDGMDKVVSEYIATIKRELTRRENELYEVRKERRS